MTKTEQIELAKKYHFWALAALVLIVALLSWFLASSALTEEFESNRGKREAVRSRLQGIRPDAPNASHAEETKKRTVDRVTDVRSAWQTEFDRQQPTLQWAAEQFGPEFAAEIKKVGPEGTIAPRFLELFQNQAGDMVQDHLFPIPQPRKQREIARASSTGDDSTNKGDWEGLVTWLDGPDKIFSRMQYESRPTSVDVHFALQDVNLYRNVLEVVRKTNEGAVLHTDASIKQISVLAIGQATEWPMKPLPEGAAPEEPVEGAPKKDPARQLLLEGRFCDEYGFRLMAAAPPPYREFNIVPCKMQLIMDQRAIPEFLANCAAAPIPFEVRKLDIRWIGDPTQPKLEPNLGAQTEIRAYDILLDLQATMYIYNSPDVSPLLTLPESPAVVDPADPNNVDPNNVDPNNVDPNNVDPNNPAPIDPAAVPADPAAVPVDPAVPADPGVPADPAAAPVDPAAVPVDPAAAPVDPAAAVPATP